MIYLYYGICNNLNVMSPVTTTKTEINAINSCVEMPTLAKIREKIGKEIKKNTNDNPFTNSVSPPDPLTLESHSMSPLLHRNSNTSSTRVLATKSVHNMSTGVQGIDNFSLCNDRGVKLSAWGGELPVKKT